MERIGDVRMFAQLIRLLGVESLRAYAARAHRAGWSEDLAALRTEFQRRRVRMAPSVLRAA